tara:strand:+ start:1341 stop:1625 length:285 start_codon:yes stop_codon:yes gene_type:complete
MKIQVNNMTSPNGNFVPNQFVIKIKNSYYFQSYQTIIAQKKLCLNNGDYKIILDTNALNYSRTTSKYLYKFLNMNRKEIESEIKTKEIKLKNLN